jgi:hypothetical protein
MNPLLLFWLATLAAPRDHGEWRPAADMPTTRALHMSAFLESDSGRVLLVAGGQRTAGEPMEPACFALSPSSNSWHALSPLRYPRGLGRLVAVRGKAYALGGCETYGTGLSRVECFDPLQNRWTNAPNMPESLYDFAAVVWRDSLVLVLGGGNWSPNSPPNNHVWVFDPATGTWQPGTSLPAALGAATAGIFDDTVVLAAGWIDGGLTNQAWLGIINPANPTQLDWSPTEPLPGAGRCRATAAVQGGRLLLIGGACAESASARRPLTLASGLPEGMAVCSEVWSYDPALAQWEQLPDFPTPLCNASASTVRPSGRVYVAGGYAGMLPYAAETWTLDRNDLVHDAGVARILSPLGRLVADSTYAVRFEVVNNGATMESAEARFVISDAATGAVLTDRQASVTLEPDSTTEVSLGSFVPPGSSWFILCATVQVDDDENPDNDTLRGQARTARSSEPDGFGYVYESTQEPDTVEFSWIDTTGSVRLTGWDPNPDDGTVELGLPFSFPFYGGALSDVSVSTNGFLSRDDFAGSLGRPLPCAATSMLAAPYWDDLTLTAGGQVLARLEPDRAVITWLGVPRLGSPADTLSFQVVLSAHGSLQFNFLRVPGGAQAGTIGIQDSFGNWAWYSEYAHQSIPSNHIITDSTSILYYRASLHVVEQRAIDLSPRSLDVRPTVASASVRITAPSCGRVRVFDATGRAVAELGNTVPAGALCWRLTDSDGRRVRPGVYLLTCGDVSRAVVVAR